MDAKTVKGLIGGAMSAVRQAFKGVTGSSSHSTDNPTYSVDGLMGEALPDVELFQQFGFSSRLPGGTQVIVVPLGGKTSHGVIIASENSGVRIKKLAEGEAVMFSEEGAFVHIKKGRIIDVECDEFNVKCNDFNVTTKTHTIKTDTSSMQATADVTVVAGGQMGITSNTFGVAAAGGSNIEGGLEIKQKLIVRETIHADGKIDSSTDVLAKSVSLHGHVHTETQSVTKPPTV